MDDGFKREDIGVAKDKEAEDVEKGTETQIGKDGAEEVVRVQTNASKPELPFSKARTVALVATVAAAPFLSVSLYLVVNEEWQKLMLCVQTMAVQASVIILPTIGEALDIPTSRQQWIVSAYNLTFGCFLVCTIYHLIEDAHLT